MTTQKTKSKVISQSQIVTKTLILTSEAIKEVLNIKFSITGNKTVCLQDYKGKNLVLYFYPKDNTPGCTQEGKDFTKLYTKLQKSGTQVLGVSRDSVASHEKFKAQYGYSFDLISDPDTKLCKAFDVLKQKNNFGKISIGIIRSTFVFNKKLELVKEWRQLKVQDHAQKVYDFVKGYDCLKQ